MERRQRRSFTDDYKQQAVDLVASSGRSAGSVAKDDGGVAAPHHAGGAAVGGPSGRDFPFATGE